MTLDQAIDTIMQLPGDQQDMLLEILYHRRIEKRRQEIVREAQESLAAFRTGKYKAKTASAVIAELREEYE
jgi:hypothetical protein